MKEIAIIDVRAQDKTILVHFVWVVWGVTHPGGESILRNYIPFNIHRLVNFELITFGWSRWSRLKFVLYSLWWLNIRYLFRRRSLATLSGRLNRKVIVDLP